MTLTFFQGRGSLFKNENLHFLLVNTITQQILVTLGPKLYHGCISGDISRIGPKLIPWMYLRSVLVKFEDGCP